MIEETCIHGKWWETVRGKSPHPCGKPRLRGPQSERNLILRGSLMEAANTLHILKCTEDARPGPCNQGVDQCQR